MYPFMIKRNSCKSHFLQRTGQRDEHTRGMNFHTTKKALTMVHPVDEQKVVNPIAVPPAESQMEDYLLYLTGDEENGDNGDVKEKATDTMVVRSVLSHGHQQKLCDE